MAPQSPWKWRYHPWLGVMWGPIPAGLILLVIGGLVVYLTYYAE